MCLPNHSNIVDMSDDMTCLHLKHFRYGNSLFFTLRPFQSNGFLLCVGGLLNQFYRWKCEARGSRKRKNPPSWCEPPKGYHTCARIGTVRQPWESQTGAGDGS